MTTGSPKTKTRPDRPRPQSPLERWVDGHRLCGRGYQWESRTARDQPVYVCLGCGESFPDDFPAAKLAGVGA